MALESTDENGQTSPERLRGFSEEEGVLQAVSSAAWEAAGGLAVNLALDPDARLGQTSPERGSVVSSGEGGLCTPGCFLNSVGGGRGDWP